MTMDELRTLMALGFTGLAVMLRVEADRFGAAEYAETDRYGQHPRLRRRLAWFILGLGLCVAIWAVNPDKDGHLYIRLGDRGEALLGGMLYGAIGVAQAIAFAYLRYRHLRLPDPASYPAALLNSIGTALVDEITFRGAVLGFLILAGLDAGTAIIVQALLYGLATRLGAPRRDRYILALTLIIGLASGYVTVQTGALGAAFLGHAITRFATFVATGHFGLPAGRGREIEDIERKRRMPEGWATVGAHRHPGGPDE